MEKVRYYCPTCNGIMNVDMSKNLFCESCGMTIKAVKEIEVDENALGKSSLTIDEMGKTQLLTVDSRKLKRCDPVALRVVIPEGVTHIEAGAFKNCTVLTSVYIPEDVEYIGEGAFDGCVSLEKIIIPKTVVRIGSEAFLGCKSLSSAVIRAEIDTIPEKMFKDCVSLKSVEIQSEGIIKTVGASAFHNCSSLEGITVPEGVCSIGQYAFTGCSNMSYLNLPSTLRTVSLGAFYNCSSLVNVEIPDGVSAVGFNAFAGCSGVRRLTVPLSVTDAHLDAFSGCCNLQYIRASASIMQRVNLSKVKELVFLGNPNIVSSTNVNIKLTQVDSRNMIIPNTALEKVSFEGTGFKINHHTFAFCRALRSIDLKGVWEIGTEAFKECNAFDELTVPDGIKVIGDKAFSGCSAVDRLYFYASGAEIGIDAFYGCGSIQEVHIENMYAWCSNRFKAPGSNPLVFSKRIYQNGESVREIEVPEGIIRLDSTFVYLIDLKKVTIPESVEYVSSTAFYGCNEYVEVTVLGNKKRVKKWDKEWQYVSRGMLGKRKIKNVIFK